MGGTSAGVFVVLEGIDGAGTTTQTARLASALRARGATVRITREPSDGPIGMTIRQILTGRVVGVDGRAPGWATMALLFAADRMDHVETDIEPALARGAVVISDRYDFSSLAYQSAVSGRGGADTVEWIRTLNSHARRPDLTIVLDLPAATAAARRVDRGEPAQLYEQHEVQQALAAFYRELPRAPSDRIVVVDAGGTADEVEARIVAQVDAFLEARKS